MLVQKSYSIYRTYYSTYTVAVLQVLLILYVKTTARSGFWVQLISQTAVSKTKNDNDGLCGVKVGNHRQPAS